VIDQKNDPYKFQRKEQIVEIEAFVLMPNHFHLLIKNTYDISLFMKKLQGAYTLYFNQKYNRSGTLWESKFKSIHIENDKYYKYLFSFMQLNPIKLIQSNWKEKGIKNINKAWNFLENYSYSSLITLIPVRKDLTGFY
jgi:putative transposase